VPEDELVAKAFDADKHVELAEAIQNLNADEAQFFLEKLERAIRKRKIMISGYLAAMLIWVVGMAVGLVWFGMSSGGFMGWVFLMPFLGVGIVLYAFGKWANRVGDPPAKK
jgi:hypothetical protein